MDEIDYSPPHPGGNQIKVIGLAVNQLGESPPAGSIPAPPTDEREKRALARFHELL